MRFGFRPALAIALAAQAILPASAATFGTIVAPTGGAAYSDIVLDRTGSFLYLVNNPANRIDVYSLKTHSFAAQVATDAQPVAAAISLDGASLYVTTYTNSVVDVISLVSLQITNRISLPSNPEGIAVAGDGRVLISAVAAAGVTGSTLLVYDPSATSTNPLSSIPVTPPAPPSPVVPSPVGRVFVSYRSHLLASPDGKYVVGLNALTGATTSNIVVFVYETASGTVLRSREVANLSSVLSISPDGSEFMAGSTLFSTATLQILAQENSANAPFTFPSSTSTAGNFNLQANQGGSVFAPDGSVLYAGFNIAAGGAASANILLLNDPQNLLITLGLQLPENLAGKMVIDSAGANIYAISDSGFTIIPVGTYRNSPIAQPASQVMLLTSDECGVYASQRTVTDTINNGGKGRFTVSVSPAAVTTTTVAPVGPGGAGGFGPGGGTVVTTTTSAANAPTTSVSNTGASPVVTFRFNNAAAVNPGTTGPADFVVTSNEAINVPGNIHTFQNYRPSESRGTIFPAQINASAGEGLADIVLDSTRNRLYIANAGLNRVEVFDTKAQAFLTPIKVGQLPQAMALSIDNNTLWVANTGGESISVVDLTKGIQTGIVPFPALPFDALVTISTPQTIAYSLAGPQFAMSDGTLWHIVNDQAIPRPLNTAVFGTAARTVSGGTPSFWNMAGSPDGQFVLLYTGAGVGYLYNYISDDFTLTSQIHTTPLTGYAGPVTAGPGGSYFSVGGTILNASLKPLPGVNAGGLAPSGREVAAVTAVTATALVMFTEPVRASATAAVTDAGLLELYNPVTETSAQPLPTLEGAPSVVIGTTRVSAWARTMAIDTVANNAWVLTATGLSLVPLTAAGTPQTLPAIHSGGIVSLADYTAPLAAGGLMTIFGDNLGAASTGSSPLPTSLGGTCVTLNGSPIPMSLVSPGQINAAIPSTLAAGRYPVVIHSLTSLAASASTTISISKYAPAVFAAYLNGGWQSAIVHMDGTFVTPDNPATRDEYLSIFTTGMGPTSANPAVGTASPSSPLATICTTEATCAKEIQVYFGPTGDTRSPVVVEWAGLAPDLIGVYQINVYVPGTHITGDNVPVAIKIGGVTSSLTGPVAPTVALN